MALPATVTVIYGNGIYNGMNPAYLIPPRPPGYIRR